MSFFTSLKMQDVIKPLRRIEEIKYIKMNHSDLKIEEKLILIFVAPSYNLNGPKEMCHIIGNINNRIRIKYKIKFYTI